MRSLGSAGVVALCAAFMFLFAPIIGMLGMEFGLSWFFEDWIPKKYPLSIYGIFGLGALGMVILIRLEHILLELRMINQENELTRYFYKQWRRLPVYDEDGQAECVCGDLSKREERYDICNSHYPEFLRWLHGATEAHEIGSAVGSAVRYVIEDTADVLAEKIARRLRENTE